MVREHERGGAADGSELRGLEVALRERGREPRGEEQHVPIAQRQSQLVGEAQHHLARGSGAPGLDEAEVTRRDARVHGDSTTGR